MCIDQFTKFLALKYLKDLSSIKIINNILELTYVENNGAAFGILQGKQTFFYILTGFVLLFIIYIFVKKPFNKHYLLLNISLLLIFSGACGNFIDRLTNRFVIDFIYFVPINFPVFNFADVMITCGTALLFLGIFTVYKHDDII